MPFNLLFTLHNLAEYTALLGYMRCLEFCTVLDLEKGSAGIYVPYVATLSRH